MCKAYLPDSYCVSNHSRLQYALHLLKVGFFSQNHLAQLQNRHEQSAKWFGASPSGRSQYVYASLVLKGLQLMLEYTHLLSLLALRNNHTTAVTGLEVQKHWNRMFAVRDDGRTAA